MNSSAALYELGSLDRDESGNEVWEIRNRAGEIIAEGIASDHDAAWIAQQEAAK